MSLYVVYVLEIVKLNNPRRLRRDHADDHEQLSA